MSAQSGAVHITAPASFVLHSFALQHILVELVHSGLGGEDPHEHPVAHGSREHVGEAFGHLELVGVFLHDLLVADNKLLAVPPPGEGAEGMLSLG